MKPIKYLAFTFTILLASFANSQTLSTGQTYKTAVGIRGVGTSGMTIKHFKTSNTAYEGIIGFYPNAFSATLLIEKYTPAFDVSGLDWYYGIGGHVASQSNVVRGESLYRRETTGFGIGIDGIFGIEYKIDEVPIAISLDIKPFIEIVENGGSFIALDPGLGIKVTF